MHSSLHGLASLVVSLDRAVQSVLFRTESKHSRCTPLRHQGCNFGRSHSSLGALLRHLGALRLWVVRSELALTAGPILGSLLPVFSGVRPSRFVTVYMIWASFLDADGGTARLRSCTSRRTASLCMPCTLLQELRLSDVAKETSHWIRSHLQDKHASSLRTHSGTIRWISGRGLSLAMSG